MKTQNNVLKILVALRWVNSVPMMLFLGTLNIMLTRNGMGLKVAADDVGIFFTIYFFLSVIGGYLVGRDRSGL